MVKSIPVLLIVSLIALAPGCHHEAPGGDVDKAAAQFFMRLQSASYDKIYDDASDTFKGQNAKLTVIDNLQKITAIGRIQEWHRITMKFADEGGTRMALPYFSVRFDTTAVDMPLKFADDNGEWKLMGFAVNPRTRE